MTPLLEACRLGHKRVSRILEENGASKEHRDSVRHWNATDWGQEHERQLEAAERTRNRSYDKPWLAVKKNPNGNNSAPEKLRQAASQSSGGVSDGQGLLSDGGGSSSDSTDGRNPERARSGTIRKLTRANTGTMPALPNINSTKLGGLTRTWTEEGGTSKELITAKFYPSPVPFSNPSLTTDAERTHNAYGQWRMTQNLRPVDLRSRVERSQSDRTAWQGEFRQIFKQYEHQVTESFRKKAKLVPVGYNYNYRFQGQHSPYMTNPFIAVEDDRKAPSSRLSRQKSLLDTGPLLKRLTSVNSVDTVSVSSRRTAGVGAGHKGKRDPEWSYASSSVDSAAAAKMIMNAFRRRKPNAFSSSTTIEQ